jgi:hypothetical protein
VAIGYLADAGCWSESMADCLAEVDLIGIEFNHDVELQKSSRRPDYLIERNLSDEGHLSNVQGAELLQAVLARSQLGAPRHVVLLHLSEQCNQPELALRAARDTLEAAGSDAQVHIGRQTLASPSILLSSGRGRRRGFGHAAGAPQGPRVRKKQPAQKSGPPPPAGLLRFSPDQDDFATEIL